MSEPRPLETRDAVQRIRRRRPAVLSGDDNPVRGMGLNSVAHDSDGLRRWKVLTAKLSVGKPDVFDAGVCLVEAPRSKSHPQHGPVGRG